MHKLIQTVSNIAAAIGVRVQYFLILIEVP